MSRVIKFRAWFDNGKTKDMFFVGDAYGTTHPLDCWRYAQEGQPVTLMQFTGLLDVNGVEIYEGDIVEILDTDHSNKDAIINWLDGKEDMPVKRVGVDVVVMDRFPVYWLKKEEFGYEGEELISPRKARIIGNIFQNPELLSCAG